ncbi:MAG: M13 family metallopeptidase [bacterium]|nr:M13 family metallopeptidase [bacterium]MDI1335365.1 M13 family metallopeptidase [Lacunisphaera sp.]
MKLHPLLLATGLVLLSLPSLRAADLPAPPKPVAPRFSAANMDRSIDPRVDFARYAWGSWSKANPIPADKSRWGAFNELDQYNQTALKGILETAAAKSHEPGSLEQKVGDFYASAMNTAAIDAAGLKPIETDLAQVAAIVSPADLARAVASLHNQQVGALFNVGVAPDEKNSVLNVLQAFQGGLSLPSKEYYFAAQYEKQRTGFAAHVAKIFMLAGDTPEAAAAGAKTVFEAEKSLAANARTPIELRDSLANYNKMPTAELAAKLPALPFALYLGERGIGGPAAADIIVGQPKFFEGLQEQLAARSLSDWKTYLRYHILRADAAFLAAPFEAERFRFYSTELQGTPAMEPRWQRSARIVDGEIGEALGQLYVAQYYPPEAKAKMDRMIKNIVDVMHDRLGQLDWMTAETRQKALAKFDRFYAKVGHPEKWRDYSTVKVGPGGYFANIRAANEFEDKRNIAKLGQPVDKTEWFMSPPTVNAYFDPTANNINFPAGILQPPFFDFTLDDAVNYGGIGAVIGHEITHGFDDQGCHYDGNGNLSDWWTEADTKEFKARAQKMVDQYNGYEVLPGVHVKGELTLGENIADLGGITLAYEALERSLAGKERKKIDGLTEEQRFFLAWAQVWRTNIRDAEQQRRVNVDPHAPGWCRTIGPLVNFQPFYEAFGIKEGDPMWVPPEKRAKIW